MGNPFEQPGTIDPLAEPATELRATELAIGYLVKTKPWMTFISILLKIAGAWGILLFIRNFFNYIEFGFISFINVISMLILITYCLILFFLASRLKRFGIAVHHLSATKYPRDLDIAMVMQMQFWRLIGILGILSVLLVLYSIVMAIFN